MTEPRYWTPIRVYAEWRLMNPNYGVQTMEEWQRAVQAWRDLQPPRRSRQTFDEEKGGHVYCALAGRKNALCPRHPKGFKFTGKKKCAGCSHARYNLEIKP